MIKISIIITMYNVERWLRRCLNTLVKQTLKDIEIICVDDGSPDKCAKICEEYAAHDNRITVIRQKNGGLAAARNAGMKIAKGEYIGFVDPDDSVDIDFFEKLYLKAKRTNADIVKGQKYQIPESKLFPKWIEPIYKTVGKISIFTANKRIKKNRGHFTYGCWSAIYKREFLEMNDIVFPVGVITGQDNVFLTKAICLANKLEFVNGAYYNYFRRNDSLDSKILNATKTAAKIQAANLIVDFINSVDIAPDVYGAIFKRRLRMLLGKVFSRSSDANARLTLAKSAIELYNKCKHPQNCVIKEYEKYLSIGNADGLYKYLEKKFFNEKRI